MLKFLFLRMKRKLSLTIEDLVFDLGGSFLLSATNDELSIRFKEGI